MPKHLNDDNLNLLIYFKFIPHHFLAHALGAEFQEAEKWWGIKKYMPVARQRHTKARRDRARVFYKIKAKKLVVCGNCKAEKEAHIVCPKCGYYKGKEVVDTMKKTKKKAAKKAKK